MGETGSNNRIDFKVGPIFPMWTEITNGFWQIRLLYAGSMIAFDIIQNDYCTGRTFYHFLFFKTTIHMRLMLCNLA